MRILLSLLLFLFVLISNDCWASDYPIKPELAAKSEEMFGRFMSLGDELEPVIDASVEARQAMLDSVYSHVSDTTDMFFVLMLMLDIEAAHGRNNQKNSYAISRLIEYVETRLARLSIPMKTIYKRIGRTKDPVSSNYLIQLKDLNQEAIDLLNLIRTDLQGVYKELEMGGAK